jgi:hypothetical protein
MTYVRFEQASRSRNFPRAHTTLGDTAGNSHEGAGWNRFVDPGAVKRELPSCAVEIPEPPEFEAGADLTGISSRETYSAELFLVMPGCSPSVHGCARNCHCTVKECTEVPTKCPIRCCKGEARENATKDSGA